MDLRAAREHIEAVLQRDADPARRYHGVRHTLDVYTAALRIAELEGVTGEDRDLLATAALYHDSGFLIAAEDHEQHGCDLLRAALPAFGYTPRQVERVAELVLGTRVPQNPTDLLGRILCDADLDYLGRPDFVAIGDDLCAELMHFGKVADVEAWDRMQLHFLSAHSYFTATCQRDREPGKQANLAVVRARVQRRQG